MSDAWAAFEERHKDLRPKLSAVKCYCGKCSGYFMAAEGVSYGPAEVHFTLPVLASHPEGRPAHRNGEYEMCVR